MKSVKKSKTKVHTRLLIRSIFSFMMLYILSFLMGGVFLYLTVLFLFSSELRERYGIPSIAAVVLFCASIFLLYKMILSLFQSYKGEMKGMRRLSRDEMPELFDMIDEVAVFMKTVVPQEVYLSPSVTASVFLSTSSTLFYSPRKKKLEIGIGLIHTLTKEELRAVIAHEMGHFSQKSMFLGGYVYSIEQAIYYISRQIDFNKNGGWEHQVKGLFGVFHAFAQLFFYKLKPRFQAFSLELEYDADGLAAECVGASTLRSALLKTSYASVIYQDVITILGNWAVHGKCIADIYAAHRYTMDAYLSALGDDLHSFDNCWASSAGRTTLPPALLSRLNRLADTRNKKSESREPLSRLNSSMLLPYTLFFTKFIYSEVYGKSWDELEECHLLIYRKWIADYALWQAAQSDFTKEYTLHVMLPAKLHRLPLVNSKLVVYVDKKEVGEGSFKKGIDILIPITPDQHSVSITCWGECFMNSLIYCKTDELCRIIHLDYKVELTKGRYKFFIVENN